jgi:TolB-like protein/tetratricopeptide (TPR) repeat protein
LNGNVASRILPVKIHDLDSDDRSLLETELGSPLRSIDFIYKEEGVNRPLKPIDNRIDNHNKTDYHNQINKVANAIKQLVHSIQYPDRVKTPEVDVNQERSPLSNQTNSIAVLPFLNMSNDQDQDYFCDGISEEIMNALAQLENLRVVARTSAFAFKNKNLDVREIGNTLDVQTLLEGSVRKSGNRVRITTQLVQVSDGSYLWSNRYDRDLEDIFTIQENIAENVATALKGILTKKEKEAIRRPETVIEAYECYLKGRQNFHQLQFEPAKKMFEQAISIDVAYALAYSGLADVHSWLYEWEGARKEDLEAAEKYSTIAISLAPTLSESHSSRGYVLSLAQRFDESEEAFKKAIQLNSNNYDAYYFYGRSSFSRGEISRSAELFRMAADVRKEDFQSMIFYAQSLTVLKDEREESALFESIRRGKKQLEINPDDRRALSLLPRTMHDFGEEEKALELMNRALRLYPNDVSVLINAACYFAKAGPKEKALSILESILGKGFGKKDWIEHDPDYDSLRDEPRFKALLRKMS